MDKEGEIKEKMSKCRKWICLKHGSSSKNANSKYTLHHVKSSQNTKVKMCDMKDHIEANHVSFIATLNWWSVKKEAG